MNLLFKFKSCSSPFVLAIAVLLFTTSLSSFADTYELFALHSDQDYFFYGMDDSGTVVITTAPGCETNNCFFTYSNGVLTDTTATAPSIVDDQGTPCTPSLPLGGTVLHGVCNNGREAFTGSFSQSQIRAGVYTGPSLDDVVYPNGAGLVFMNSVGDIVFDDDFQDTWFEAIDMTTTPEPGTLILLGTGMIGLAGIARRKFSRT